MIFKLVYCKTSKLQKEYYKKFYGNYSQNHDIHVCFKIENNKIFIRYGNEIEFDEISLKKAIEEIKHIDQYINFSYKHIIKQLKQEINNIFLLRIVRSVQDENILH